MFIFIQNHVIVSHVQINNCSKLESYNDIEGVLKIWHRPRVTSDYFVQLYEISNQYDSSIFIGNN